MTASDLDEAWEVLDAREREILTRRFGLDEREPETLKAVGERLGFSAAYVRELQQRALRRLRRAGEQLEEFGKILPRQVIERTQKAPGPKKKKRKKRKPALVEEPRLSDSQRLDLLQQLIRGENIKIDVGLYSRWSLEWREETLSAYDLRGLIDAAQKSIAKRNNGA